jgi:6-phosphofructokinase 1
MVAHKNGGSRYGGIGTYLSNVLENYVTAEIRSTALGHVQRGGHPVYRDRLIAAAFGAEAIECVAQENFDRMVAWHNSTVTNIPLEKALETYSSVDLSGKIIQSAMTLGICLGVPYDKIK